jgi:signal transduction histidine kinase
MSFKRKTKDLMAETKKISDEELIEELQRRFKEKAKAVMELRDLTVELTLVNKKLTESEALKTHFISNITNEIINPFASIIGLAKNILAVPEGDWKKVRAMTKLIHDEAFNLDFQLKNIFSAAEFEAGETELQIANVEIIELIHFVIDSFNHLADKKQVTIEFENLLKSEPEKPFTFKTDPEKLQLVLFNLIDNAIKFSNATGRVEIKTWIEYDNLNISVQDYGIGISDEHQKIIFDRFKRLDSGINSMNRGHGLGLSVNKAIVDLMKGKIDVKSRKKQGALFLISIPELQNDSEVDDFATDGSQLFFGDKEVF